MRLYLSQNVYDAALDRIRWLFDEFPNVVVNVSGGKDSTVVRELALQVAEERGRLPLKVLFVDLEAEWESVIEYMREVMADPRIEPIWLQIPMRLFNASSASTPYLDCWAPGAKWMRPQEPGSWKENRYGTDRIAKLFKEFDRVEFPNTPTCQIAGVRAEESQGRSMGLTGAETYRGVTWGKKQDPARGHYSFYPIYDWSYTDVWKAIHAHGWPYCKIYDLMYQQGVSLNHMRVSSIVHEGAVNNLFTVQEIEPDTWNRLTQRLAGTNTAATMQQDFYCPDRLPFMFSGWKEDRNYLLENLIEDPATRAKLKDQFTRSDALYTAAVQDKLTRLEINIILSHEHEMVALDSFRAYNSTARIKNKVNQ